MILGKEQMGKLFFVYKTCFEKKSLFMGGESLEDSLSELT